MTVSIASELPATATLHAGEVGAALVTAPAVANTSIALIRTPTAQTRLVQAVPKLGFVAGSCQRERTMRHTT
jgi:hypothetical protein